MERARAALADDADNPDLQTTLARALIGMKRWDEAEVSVRAALAQVPDHLEARYQLALITTETGGHEEAARIYECLLAQAPENAIILAGNARLYVVMRKPEAARRVALRALAAAPDHADGHRMMALACAGFWKYRHDARRHAEVALQLQPNDARSHIVSGTLALCFGRPREARRRFREARRLDPMAKLDRMHEDAELAALWHHQPVYYVGLVIGRVRGWKWPLQVLLWFVLIGAVVAGLRGRELVGAVIAAICLPYLITIETLISRSWLRRRLG